MIPNERLKNNGKDDDNANDSENVKDDTKTNSNTKANDNDHDNDDAGDTDNNYDTANANGGVDDTNDNTFVDRGKFRSQTSDNMDKWKIAEVGRVREKKRSE